MFIVVLRKKMALALLAATLVFSVAGLAVEAEVGGGVIFADKIAIIHYIAGDIVILMNPRSHEMIGQLKLEKLESYLNRDPSRYLPPNDPHLNAFDLKAPIRRRPKNSTVNVAKGGVILFYGREAELKAGKVTGIDDGPDSATSAHYSIEGEDRFGGPGILRFEREMEEGAHLYIAPGDTSAFVNYRVIEADNVHTTKIEYADLTLEKGGRLNLPEGLFEISYFYGKLIYLNGAFGSISNYYVLSEIVERIKASPNCYTAPLKVQGSPPPRRRARAVSPAQNNTPPEEIVDNDVILKVGGSLTLPEGTFVIFGRGSDRLILYDTNGTFQRYYETHLAIAYVKKNPSAYTPPENVPPSGTRQNVAKEHPVILHLLRGAKNYSVVDLDGDYLGVTDAFLDGEVTVRIPKLTPTYQIEDLPATTVIQFSDGRTRVYGDGFRLLNVDDAILRSCKGPIFTDGEQSITDKP